MKNLTCPECGSEDVYGKDNKIHCLYCSTHSNIVKNFYTEQEIKAMEFSKVLHF